MKKLLLVSVSTVALLGASAQAETVLVQKGNTKVALGESFIARAYGKSQKAVIKTTDSKTTYKKDSPISMFSVVQVPTLVVEQKGSGITFRATLDGTDAIVSSSDISMVRFDLDTSFGQFSFNTDSFAASDHATGVKNYGEFSHTQYFTKDDAGKGTDVRFQSYISTGDNAKNIQYTSPEFFGVTVAASYQAGENGKTYNDQKAKSAVGPADASTLLPNVASGVVAYKGQFGTVGVNTVVGYTATSYKGLRGGATKVANVPTFGRINVMNVGGQVTLNKNILFNLEYAMGTAHKPDAVRRTATEENKYKLTTMGFSVAYDVENHYGASVFFRTAQTKRDKTTKAGAGTGVVAGNADSVKNTEIGVTGQYYLTDSFAVHAALYQAKEDADANKKATDGTATGKEGSYAQPKASAVAVSFSYDF